MGVDITEMLNCFFFYLVHKFSGRSPTATLPQEQRAGQDGHMPPEVAKLPAWSMTECGRDVDWGWAR